MAISAPVLVGVEAAAALTQCLSLREKPSSSARFEIGHRRTLFDDLTCPLCPHNVQLSTMADLNYTMIALIASLASYVVYNALFLAAQLWEAFATLALGTYYIVLFVGHFKQNKTALIVGTGLQAIATLILIGLFVFFVVEIFVPHSLIYQVLTYIKNTEETRRVRIARNTSIAMAVDSLITAGLHFWALTMCFLECRQHQNVDDKPFEALAIRTEIDVPDNYNQDHRYKTQHSKNGERETKQLIGEFKGRVLSAAATNQLRRRDRRRHEIDGTV